MYRKSLLKTLLVKNISRKKNLETFEFAFYSKYDMIIVTFLTLKKVLFEFGGF